MMSLQGSKTGTGSVWYAGRVGRLLSSRTTMTLLIVLAVVAGSEAGPQAWAPWVPQIVENPALGTGETAIAVQPGGQAHAAYTGPTTNALRYASNAYGAAPSWKTLQQIDSQGEADSPSLDSLAMAVDSTGNLHVTYFETYNHTIQYATNRSGAWTHQAIESNPNFHHSAIAADSNNRVHILTILTVDHANNLRYTTNAGESGSWSNVTIDSVANRYVTIFVDAANVAHVLYSSGGELRYATNLGGSWAHSTIASVTTSMPTALYVESPSHQVHAVYADDDTLRCATKAPADPVWTIEQIGDTGATSGTIIPSLTVDGTEAVTVNYFVGTDRKVRQALKSSGGWQASSVLNTIDGALVDNPAITTDPTGKVHLVYRQDNQVKYVTNAAEPRGADLEVTQTRATGTILVDRPVEYTVTVTNHGPDQANNVVVKVNLHGATFESASAGSYVPADDAVIWNIPLLAVEDPKSVVITVRAPATAGTMTVDTNVSSDEKDFRTDNDKASASDEVIRPTHVLNLAVVGGTGGGIVAPNGQQPYEGDEVSVTATPDPGWRVKQWHGTRNDASTSNDNTVLIGTADRTAVSVEFERITWQLNASVSGGPGTITPSGGVYNDGTRGVLTVTPGHHYRVKGWTGTNNDQATGVWNTVTMTQDRTVGVVLEPAPNQAPVASFLMPSVVDGGDLVDLDATASYDPDEDPLTYKWEVYWPVQMAVSGTSTPTFLAPTGQKDEIIVTVTLTVSDGQLSDQAEELIKVRPAGTGGTGTGSGKSGIRCGQGGVGAANFVLFYTLAFAGLACVKWNGRCGRRSR